MRIVFLGTPAFAVPSLDALAGAGHELICVVAQPDRPAGRGNALKPPATKEWALARRIPVLQPEKVRDGKLCSDLAALKPDLLAVAAYGRILGKDLLTLAPHGAINVHGSLLPKYRGAAPIQWAIANGDPETGVTIMHMDEGLDSGDVLLQRALPIGPADTAETLSPRLAALGGEALVEALSLLSAGRITPVKQDPSEVTLAPILTREDGRIDWSRPASVILNRLRGFTPWPGAWTRLDGKVLKVLAAEAEEARADAATWTPGTATAVAGRGIAVLCGHPTALLVRRLQAEGKPPQAAADFANGLRKKQLALGE